MTTTRIYHRIDNSGAWLSASLAGAGKLSKGEIGLVTTTLGQDTDIKGYLGVSDTPTVYSQCPVVLSGYVEVGVAETIVSQPVVYQAPATSPSTGSTLSWDSANSKWIVDEEVLNLDTYPTADGTVVWNQSLGKFQVGAAVSAVDLDGGEYTV
jgi:hypothetical protein